MSLRKSTSYSPWPYSAIAPGARDDLSYKFARRCSVEAVTSSELKPEPFHRAGIATGNRFLSRTVSLSKPARCATASTSEATMRNLILYAFVVLLPAVTIGISASIGAELESSQGVALDACDKLFR